MEELERLQKYLARCGVASRRKCEDMIKAGKVKVNNKVITQMGTKINPRKDKIKVNGKKVSPENYSVLIMNKPPGVLSTVSDPTDRQTVIDLLPPMSMRLYPVGRLDYYSEGLILLTNDGNLTQGLLHPKNDVPRVYEVKIKGHIKDSDLVDMRKGVDLDDGKTKPLKVEIMEALSKNTWLRFTVTEGRNRLIRKICEKYNHTVLRLVRVKFGNIQLNDLKPGKYKIMNKLDIDKLRKAFGISKSY
jgi:23S rRNA pseudouridine2605 synthase